MGVCTSYDEIRESLRDKLDECMKLAKLLLDDDVWGA